MAAITSHGNLDLATLSRFLEFAVTPSALRKSALNENDKTAPCVERGDFKFSLLPVARRLRSFLDSHLTWPSAVESKAAVLRVLTLMMRPHTNISQMLRGVSDRAGSDLDLEVLAYLQIACRLAETYPGSSNNSDAVTDEKQPQDERRKVVWDTIVKKVHDLAMLHLYPKDGWVRNIVLLLRFNFVFMFCLLLQDAFVLRVGGPSFFASVEQE